MKYFSSNLCGHLIAKQTIVQTGHIAVSGGTNLPRAHMYGKLKGFSKLLKLCLLLVIMLSKKKLCGKERSSVIVSGGELNR